MVQRIKKKGTEHSEHEFLDGALHEIETWGDALVHWIGEHEKPVIIGIVGILAVAAIVGGTQSMHVAKEKKASAAVAHLEKAYRKDLGTDVQGSVRAEIAESQAPEGLRDTYAENLLKTADQYAGTAAAIQARYQAGLLKEDSKNEAAAVEIWEGLLQDLSKGSGFRPMIHLRLATAYEQLDRFEDAGNAYASVAKAPRAANSQHIRADAIRCYLKAGLTEKAQAVYGEMKTGEDLSTLPAYLRADLQSLSKGSDSQGDSNG